MVSAVGGHPKELDIFMEDIEKEFNIVGETEDEEEDDEEGLDIRRDRTEAELLSVSVLPDSTEAEGNAIVQSSTVMAGSGLARRRVKRGAGTVADILGSPVGAFFK